jgi:hypothetical protein
LNPEDIDFFQGMAIIYDRQWSNRFLNSDGTINQNAVKFWSIALKKGGVTPKDLQRCLEKTIVEYPNFAPTLPQVILMCQPSDVPDFETAFLEATVGRGRFGPGGYNKWAKTANSYTVKAFTYVDGYSFDRLTAPEARKLFSQAWKQMLADNKNQIKIPQL